MTFQDSGNRQKGCVLVFKPGTSDQKIAYALARMEKILDYQPRVNEFNPDWGGPAWYLP